MVTVDPGRVERRRLGPEWDALSDEYQSGRRFLFDHEAQAYATALKWDGDDYSDDGGIVIPDPADPGTDCALIPARFRSSFERLPDDVRPSVARIYRRALIYRAVRWGLSGPPKGLTITAAAGIEFDASERRWMPARVYTTPA